jgi:hypothetical protein
MVRRKRVSFKATKMTPKHVKVSFETRKGKRVTFGANKQVPKTVKVNFYAKRKKK